MACTRVRLPCAGIAHFLFSSVQLVADVCGSLFCSIFFSRWYNHTGFFSFFVAFLGRCFRVEDRMASGSLLMHRIGLAMCVLLLLTSLVTIGLAAHAKWVLARYFPGGEWYIWKGNDGSYDEQRAKQQWVTWEYNEVTERLAAVRAMLGVVAGALGIWRLCCSDISVGIKVRPANATAVQKLMVLQLGRKESC